MATLASHSRKNVLAVVEINKIRQVVHLHPHDRALLLYRFFELFNCNCLLLQHGVAIHAKTGWRNSRVAAGACGIVAVQTRDLVVAGVHLMGKGDRLLRCVTLMDSHPRELPRSKSAHQTQANNATEHQLQSHHASVLLRPNSCCRVMPLHPRLGGTANSNNWSAHQPKAAMQREHYKRGQTCKRNYSNCRTPREVMEPHQKWHLRYEPSRWIRSEQRDRVRRQRHRSPG